MTPKEKAKELVKKYCSLNITMSYVDEGIIIVKDIDKHLYLKDAKKCALIAVDEIMGFLLQASEYLQFPEQIKYWQQVKLEIQSL